jgi:hypothetical protein
MRSREEKQALERQQRWTEGLPGPGSIQKSRHKWGRWRLFKGKSKAERLIQKRQARAVEEPPHS